MPMPRSQLLTLLCLPLLLAACGERAAPPDTATAPAPTPQPAAPPDDEPILASYGCAGGNRVDLIREGRVAHLSLSDGRVVRLGEVAGSRPRTWMDVGLRLVVDDDYVELSQLNGARSLSCEPLAEE